MSKAPPAVEEMWRGDFDYALANCPGGIFSLTLHPQTIGRGNLMLERLLTLFKESGVLFDTMCNYATAWRRDNPLECWKAAKSDLTGQYAINP